MGQAWFSLFLIDVQTVGVLVLNLGLGLKLCLVSVRWSLWRFDVFEVSIGEFMLSSSGGRG